MARFLTGDEPPDPNDRFRTWSGCAPGAILYSTEVAHLWRPGQAIPVTREELGAFDAARERARARTRAFASSFVEGPQGELVRYFWCPQCTQIMFLKPHYQFLDDLVYCQDCQEKEQ